jgi:thymidine kinase
MDNIDNDMGFLEVIYGPMKSGKTSRLLELYKQFTFCNIPIMVINNNKDMRYSQTCLSTHDKVMIPCIHADTLTELVDLSTEEIIGPCNSMFMNSRVILINEAQFFDDIVAWVTTAVEKYNKNVYICGLNSDFKRLPFGNWLDLERICDKVTHLHSWCSLCKKRHALFSHRLSSEQDKIVIGSDNYIPVCRKCFLRLTV